MDEKDDDEKGHIHCNGIVIILLICLPEGFWPKNIMVHIQLIPNY